MTNCSSPLNHTFVVLAYGESPYLSQCLDSLLNQKRKSSVIISTSTPSRFLENTAKKYGIPIVVNQIPDGIAGDWSAAYKLARTRYVTLAHQDDIYLPEYTELFTDLAEKDQDSLIVFCNYYELCEDKDRYYSLNLIIKRLLLAAHFLLKDMTRSSFVRKSLLSFGSPICCPSVMYNTSKINSFSFDGSFTINMDWDAWLRLSRIKGSFGCIRKPLVKHRIHEDSETSRGLVNDRRRQEDQIMFLRIWPYPIAKILLFFYTLSYRGNRNN